MRFHDFQAESEGSLPFTHSNVFKHVSASAAYPEKRVSPDTGLSRAWLGRCDNCSGSAGNPELRHIR